MWCFIVGEFNACLLRKRNVIMVVRRCAMFFAIALNAGLTAIRRCAYRGDVEFFRLFAAALTAET